jgi:hypothetical protein
LSDAHSAKPRCWAPEEKSTLFYPKLRYLKGRSGFLNFRVRKGSTWFGVGNNAFTESG